MSLQLAERPHGEMGYIKQKRIETRVFSPLAIRLVDMEKSFSGK